MRVRGRVGLWVAMVYTIATGCGDDARQDTGVLTAGTNTTAFGTDTTAMTGAGATSTGGPDAPTTGGPEGPKYDLGVPTTGGSDSTSGGDTEQGVCVPPDVLILLDRTLTMHRTADGALPMDGPDYASAKWSQAISAIEGLVATPTDQAIRFGLELWPRDPGGGACITLAERIENTKQATNPMCETAEIAIAPALGNGAAIQGLLDPKTTTLCSSTPTGAALKSAGESFAGTVEPGRAQYAVLVTDGADWQLTCPDPTPLAEVQKLAAQGVKTYIVGFSGQEAVGEATAFLNDLACAGQTANGFPGPCVQGPDGYEAIDSGADVPVYLQADDASQLKLALKSISASLCCDCDIECEPPDVLVALDRTMTMHKTVDGGLPMDAPGYASSKWSQAIAAVEAMASPALENQLRFGLELWPRDDGGCITLAERVENTKSPTNLTCDIGEVVVAPNLGNSAAIAAALDPATTRLCRSTPTGDGLLTASDWMIANQSPGRGQALVLVTDGADWELTCPDPSPLAVVQLLASGGVRTYIVGFLGAEAEGGAKSFLNDMACAGQTAPGFPAPCQMGPTGYVAADGIQDALFIAANDGAELAAQLTKVAQSVDVALCQPPG